MIQRPDFIIIGSTGRNTGKTEFACRLINQYSKQYKIIGVKVTAINRDEGYCPRGTNSCGVCESLTEEYTIEEETIIGTGKDTSRMLESGAQKVYWLKVDKNFMELGIKALFDFLPDDAVVVCESNSLRKVVEPGLFIVIKNINDHTIKDSCASVINFASKLIEFDNKKWDFSPERVFVKDKTWIIREKATAVILAGGKSSRMGGEDKSLLPVDGEPLILKIINQLNDYFDEIIIGANDAEKYKFLNRKVVPDIEKEKGPLMGILSCLKASENEVNFITACDIPVMNIKLIQNMINLSVNVDIVMPVKDENKYEPLFAVYKKSTIPDAEIILNNDGRKIIELLNRVKVKFVDFNDNYWYQNLNRKEDYLRFINNIVTKKCQRSD